MQRAFEKIIERLEEEKTMAYNTYKNYEMKVDLGRAFGVENAIEIVNQVASEYGEEVCEWFKYDYRTIAPRNHDAGNPYWRIPENMNKLKYCPYCGKKIKVAE